METNIRMLFLGFVIQVSIYTLLRPDQEPATAKNAAQSPLVGIEPTTLRFLHRNRRAVGSIPTRGPCAAFFAVVPGQILKMYIYSLGLQTLKTAF